MKDIEVIDKVRASKLFKKFNCINKSGTGLVYLNQNVLKEWKYVSSILCTIEQIKIMNKNKNIPEQIPICLVLSLQLICSYEEFVQYFDTNIKQQLDICYRIQSIMLQTNVDHNSQSITNIIQFLQFNNYCLIISPKLQISNNWQQYQKQLTKFFANVIESNNILISAISIVLKLPKIDYQHQQKYLKNIISIWRRCIPVSLGSIIVNDWTDSFKKTVFKLHFIKNQYLCWKIQFITFYPNKCQQLGCECIGID